MGSVANELIWHFAGYLRLNEETALSRDSLDGAPVRGETSDEVLPQGAATKTLAEELSDSGSQSGSAAIRASSLDAIALKKLGVAPPQAASSQGLGSSPTQKPGDDADPGPANAGGGGGASSRAPHYGEISRDAGDNAIIQIEQLNALEDADLYIQGDHAPIPAGDPVPVLETVAEALSDFVPDEIAVPEADAASILDFMLEHHAELVAEVKDASGSAEGNSHEHTPAPPADAGASGATAVSDATSALQAAEASASEPATVADVAAVAVNIANIVSEVVTDSASSSAATAGPAATEDVEATASAHGAVQTSVPVPAGPASLGEWTGQFESEEGPVPGVYVNGIQQDPDAEPPVGPDLSHIPAFPEVGSVELAIQTGGNATLNAAAIVDKDGATLTSIVKGDHFSTNIVIQANVLIDDDEIIGVATEGEPRPIEVEQHTPKSDWDIGADIAQVLADIAKRGEPEVAEKPPLMSGLSTGDNVTDNVASFIQEEVSLEAPAGTARNLDVTINRFEGDFFRVHVVTQTNVISDNDIVVHEKSADFTAVVTGDSDQSNTVFVDDLGLQFDMIVVGGSFHDANYIQQINVVLDADSIEQWGEDEGSDNLSVDTGHNSLTNEASITNVGSNKFDALDDAGASFADKLIGGLKMEMSDWWPFSGSASGSMSVLVVTGDYYDVSAIFQKNIVVDVDSVINKKFKEKFGGNDDQKDRDADQVISSGSNVSVNSAQIFDFGSFEATLVGGDHYEDSLLIQGNLVSDDDKIHDTKQLASEVVAFMNDGSDDDNDDHHGFGTQNLAGLGDMFSHFMSH